MYQMLVIFKLTLFVLLFQHLCAADGFDFEAVSDRIVNEVLKEIKKKERLACVGSGGGSIGEINTVCISLESNKIVNVSEARRMIVYAAETTFKKYNECKAIRPYLHHYPFGIESVRVDIGFNKNAHDPNQVAFVFLGKKNKIHYSSFDKNGDLKLDLHEEPYEEALNIYKTQFITKEK